MSISTDANLYYGIQLGTGEDITFPWKKEDLDWKEYYAMQMGLPPIEAPYTDETRNEYRQYWEKKNKLVETSKCSIGTHCSCDYPMYYVTINKSELRAPRGYPVVVGNIKIEEDWDNALKQFCELMGLEYEQPQWWLSSMWC